jgi:hypothetical protein
MKSQAFAKSKKMVVVTAREIRALKQARARKDRSAARRSLALGSDGWTCVARKSGERDVS